MQNHTKNRQQKNGKEKKVLEVVVDEKEDCFTQHGDN